MKTFIPFLILLSFFSACQKQITPPVIPEPPSVDVPIDSTVITDSTIVDSTAADSSLTGTVVCTPFMQRTIVQLDKTHADSALLQLPCAYNAENKNERYPLLIFLNGMYEGSDYGNLNKLLTLGLTRYMADSARFSFTSGGQKYNFIVVCAQSANGFRKPKTTNQIIDYMVANYQVDTTRIYLTGLSAGANSIYTYLTDKPEYAQRIAAVVPMSTTFLDSTHRSRLGLIGQANIHALIYCGDEDHQYLASNKRYASMINEAAPGFAEFHTYHGAHKNWNPMYAPNHKYYNPNMYEWLLQFSK